MVLAVEVGEKQSADPLEDPRVRGNLLEMWDLYKELAPFPSVLSDLAIYDYITKRDGMLFPDFFKAAETYIRGSFFIPDFKGKPQEGHTLEEELELTFETMQAKWDAYGPFFERHPELRYMRHLSFWGPEVMEFGEKLPFLRAIDHSLFWSLKEYHSLRGNLDFYVELDKMLSANPNVGTLFEKNGGESPGEILIYLQPYGPAADDISDYLHLLKHGDLIGFGSVAVAGIDGKRFIAVTELQTDLLRKDRVVGVREDIMHRTRFAHAKVKRNEDANCTVPSYARRPYLSRHDWAHRIVEAVEHAALGLSRDFPVSGVIIPTLSSFTYGDWQSILGSGYARQIYEAFPGSRGYQETAAAPTFFLEGRERSVSSDGKWWMLPIEQIKEQNPST